MLQHEGPTAVAGSHTDLSIFSFSHIYELSFLITLSLIKMQSFVPQEYAQMNLSMVGVKSMAHLCSWCKQT